MEHVEQELKSCPDCAEQVQPAARVCKHCGYRFDRATATAARPPSAALEQKSPAGAAILSFVVPGLGHFYIEETWRGAVFLAAFLVATVGALITGTIGPGWLIGIAGAFDAYSGGQKRAMTRKLRPVTNGLWVMLAGVIVLVVVATVVAANRSDLTPEERGRQDAQEFLDCVERAANPDDC